MSTVQSHLANAYEVETNAQVGPNDLVFSVSTTAGSPPMPAWLVIEPEDSDQREYVKFSSKTGTSFIVASLSDRYGTDSAAGSGLTHPVGSIIRCSPLRQHNEELWNRLNEVAHDEDHAASHGDGEEDSLSTLFVPKGGGTFTGGVDVSSGGIGVVGASEVDGILDVTGNVDIDSNLNVDGNLDVVGTSVFTGAPSHPADPASANVLTRKSYTDGKVTEHNTVTAPHSAVVAATADRLILRDGSARAKVADPAVDGDIANRGWVLAQFAEVLLAEYNGDGTQSSFSLNLPGSAIPGYPHLEVSGRMAHDTVNMQSVIARINNITSADYYYTRWFQNGSTGVDPNPYVSADNEYRFFVGTAGGFKLFIPNYRSASSIITAQFESWAHYGVAAAQAEQRRLGIRLSSAGPVVDCSFNLQGGALFNGTTRVTAKAVR